MRSLVLLLAFWRSSGCMHVSDMAEGTHDHISDAGLLDHSDSRRMNNFRCSRTRSSISPRAHSLPPGSAFTRGPT
jgi:hypothetical protein